MLQLGDMLKYHSVNYTGVDTMLDELCKLNMEHLPLSNAPALLTPPANVAALYTREDTQTAQVVNLTQETQRHGMELSWEEADDMVTEQRVNRVHAFREVYVNAYTLPFEQADYQRLIRNKALNVMSSADKPEQVLKAVQLLGDTAPVQAFVPDKTLNVTINQPVEALRDDLRLKLERFLASNT
jgi:hypothetical protein